MTYTNGKVKRQVKNRGEDYKPREVVTVCENDICPICQWDIGSKKIFIHSDGTVTHDRYKCKNTYAQIIGESLD